MTGENVWMGSGYVAFEVEDMARQIVDGWMRSPGHRQNILRPNYTHLGTGVSQSGSEIRATQNFAEVWGYARKPVPPQIRRGEELDVPVAPAHRGLPSPIGFDFWAPQEQRRYPDSAPVRDGRVDVTPGVYTLRFYFPRDELSYTIVDGPRIEVR